MRIIKIGLIAILGVVTLGGCSSKPATRSDIDQALRECPDLKPILQAELGDGPIDKKHLFKLAHDCRVAMKEHKAVARIVKEDPRNETAYADQAKAVGLIQEDTTDAAPDI